MQPKVVRGLLRQPDVMPSKTCTSIRRSLVAVTLMAGVLSATWALGDERKGVRHAEASPVRGALLGTIATPDAVPVIAPVGGAVITVAVEEGSLVRQGEVLAVLAHDETKLLAPVSGVITKRSVQRGSVVRPDGAAPFHIAPAAPLRVVVEVDHATSRALRNSSIATFAVEGDDKQAYKARFASLRPEVVAAGSKPARFFASFTIEGEAKVRPGQAVQVAIKK